MLVLNNLWGMLKCLAVKPPGSGDRCKAMLRDRHPHRWTRGY